MLEPKKTSSAPDLSEASTSAGPKLSPADQTRIDHIAAMGQAFGLPAEIAEIRAVELVANKAAYASLDFKAKYGTRGDAETLSGIGRAFVAGGMTHLDSMRHPIGSHLVALLQESPTTGYYGNLGSWIGRWTDSNEQERVFQDTLKARQESGASAGITLVEPKPENLTREQHERLGHLEAMLVVLGLSEETASDRAWNLYCNRDQYAAIDPKSTDEGDRAKMTDLGTKLSDGMESYYKRFAYWIGGTAIALMHQPTNSGYFTNLDGHIGYRTESNEKQDQFLAEIEKRLELLD